MASTPGIKYLQEMQCTSCETVLEIHENEKSVVLVNARGLPINSDVSHFEVKAVCPKCGRTYEVEKNGMYFTLKNKTFEYCPHLRLQKKEEDIGFGWEV